MRIELDINALAEAVAELVAARLAERLPPVPASNAGATQLLGTREAAAYLGLSRQRLESWRCVGDGPPFIKVGRGAVRYCQSDLDQWVAAHRRANTSEGK